MDGKEQGRAQLQELVRQLLRELDLQQSEFRIRSPSSSPFYRPAFMATLVSSFSALSPSTFYCAFAFAPVQSVFCLPVLIPICTPRPAGPHSSDVAQQIKDLARSIMDKRRSSFSFHADPGLLCTPTPLKASEASQGRWHCVSEAHVTQLHRLVWKPGYPGRP